MSSSAVLVTMILLASRWPFRVQSSQVPMQLANSRSRTVAGEDILSSSQAELGAESPDYISDLWSKIEDAFRFLEERPAEIDAKEETILQNLENIRKKKKTNKLPFTQHNFIRFGKRGQDAKNLELSQDLLTSGRELQAPSFQKENLFEYLPSLQSGYLDGKFGKRQLHKFVRIGKRYFPATGQRPLGINDFISTKEDNDNLFAKRQLSKFVRIG